MQRLRHADTRPGSNGDDTIALMNPPALMEKRPTATQKTKDDQDKWFRSPEGQARHQEALDDVAEGRVEHFESGDDLLRKLKSA